MSKAPKSKKTTADGPGSFSLGLDQLAIYDQLEHTNHNYFVTGKAGTGKSVLLSYFIAHTTKKVAVLAPTGVAAVNVAGQTIHSFFQLDLGFQDVHDSRARHLLRGDKKKILKELDAIVIDEISMVRSDVLTMIDAKMRYAKRVRKPFGGCQVIFFGDPYQLQPIEVKGREETELFKHYYRGNYFFETKSYEAAEIATLELNTIYRQSDQSDVEILNHIRAGEVTSDLIDKINEKCHSHKLPEGIECIALTARNREADEANTLGLAALTTKPATYLGRLEGNMELKDCNTPVELTLKVGAQVMLTKNDPVDFSAGITKPRWINGSLATITRLGDDYVNVRIGKKEYKVEPVTWEKYGFVSDIDEDTGEEIMKRVVTGRFIQLPLRLAYAITIHKSQGQTYDAVRIDLGHGGAFATGQTYVAFSRCRSLDNLYLEHPLRPSDIRVDPKVVRWMRRG